MYILHLALKINLFARLSRASREHFIGDGRRIAVEIHDSLLSVCCRAGVGVVGGGWSVFHQLQ